MFRSLRRAPLLLVAALALSPRPAGSAVRFDPLLSDSGTYKVYHRDRLLGTEAFEFKSFGDSVRVTSDVDQTLPGPDGDAALVKRTTLYIKMLDYSLLGYVSEQQFLGRKLQRALTLFDTTFTAYREVFPSGSAETFARPPGRMFVIDPQVFVNFDLLLRSLHGRLAGERPVPVFVLGEPRDTIIEVTVRPAGTDSISLAGTSRKADKVELDDGESQFLVWVSPAGSMLRLVHPASGLRVDREMPASKPRRATKAAGGAPAKPAPPSKPPTPPGR